MTKKKNFNFCVTINATLVSVFRICFIQSKEYRDKFWKETRPKIYFIPWFLSLKKIKIPQITPMSLKSYLKQIV